MIHRAILFNALHPKSGGAWTGWLFVLVLAWVAYAPGLSGSFLFDDFINLPALGETGPITNADAFWRFITSGTADPTGRPLALLTFLLDAQNWPAEAAPFLRTNLILHLLNGTLLFLVLRKLGKDLSANRGREEFAAVTGAALWLLHPLLVSTTLYVVQREAMLPATFALGGLLLYLRGRSRFQISAGGVGMGQMLIGLLGGTALAFLSKANGILLPMLVLVIESTVLLRSMPFSNRSFAWFKRIFLGLPTLAVLFYLAGFAARWHEPARGWTIGERAMTEARVLVDYIGLLAVPRSVSTGLYNENYLVSSGILSPPSTLICIAVLAALTLLAIRVRKRAPDLSLAVAFFLAGHALESTFIPLEIYFEHRNYLPAVFLFWPLGRAIARLNWSWSARTAVAAMLVILFAATTFQRSEIWGQPGKLAALWSLRNPDSSRAQVTAATEEIRSGRPGLAAQRLDRLWLAKPDDLQIALNFVNAACATGRLDAREVLRLEQTLRHAEIGSLVARQWLERSIVVASSGRCAGLSLPIARRWIEAASSNPAIATPLAREKSLPPLFAMLALEEGNPEAALQQFDRALLANIAPATAAGQAAMLASRGYSEHALRHLDHYERVKHLAPPPPAGMQAVHAWVLDRQGYWPRELAILRGHILDELAMDVSGE